MNWWAESVENGNWKLLRDGIILHDVPTDDLFELWKAVKARTRTVERGDGVEVFRDTIRQHECKTPDELNQVDLLIFLQRKVFQRTQKDFPKAVLANAISEAREAAVEVFERHGIQFTGMETTYVYQKDGCLKFIAPNIGKAIVDRRCRWFDEKTSEEELYWLLRESRRYPWRQTFTLYDVWLNHGIDDNTALEHACRLAKKCEQLEACLSSGLNGEANDNLLLMTAIAALYVGLEHEALRKKPYEQFAMRGKTDYVAKSRAGKATEKSETKQIIASMRELIVSGHSEKRASELLHIRLKKLGVEIKPGSIRARFRYHTQ